MNKNIQSLEEVTKAYKRIKPYIHRTPVLHSNFLNKKLGAKIYFKMDAVQKTGAFKIRGVMNHLLELKEQNKLPEKIVSYSTGNHALAMSYASQIFGIKARVYLPKNVSQIKKSIAKHYGAEICETITRSEAEKCAISDANLGYHYLPPSDDDKTIAGASTMCYEALIDMKSLKLVPDIIFAPCGGGGLLSGSYLAKELVSPSSELYGCEPESAKDAYSSINNNEIFRFKESPNTIADGLRALSISNKTLNYLKKLDGFDLVSEDDIRYWTAWLIQIMKITCEPSAAIAMASAYKWIKSQHKNSNILKGKKEEKIILVLITGGNIDPEMYQELCMLGNYLEDIPLQQK